MADVWAELRKPRFTVKFPNAADGEIKLTADELEHMIESDEVVVKSDKIRSVFLAKLGEYHERQTVEAEAAELAAIERTKHTGDERTHPA